MSLNKPHSMSITDYCKIFFLILILIIFPTLRRQKNIPINLSSNSNAQLLHNYLYIQSVIFLVPLKLFFFFFYGDVDGLNSKLIR